MDTDFDRGRVVWRQFFGSAPIATAIVDRKGLVVEANTAFARLVAHEPRDITGRSIEEFVEAHDRAKVREVLMRSGYVSSSIDLDFEAVPDSRRVRVNLSAIDGDPTILLAQCVDVAGGDRDLLDQSLLCIFILRERIFRYVNPKFSECLSWGPEDLVGKHLLDVVAPEDRQRISDALRALEDGERDEIVEVAGMLRKDGEVMPAELHVASTRFEHESSFIGSVTDVSGRVRAEEERRRVDEALERAANEWRTTFDAVETPIIVANADASIARINRAARMIAGKSYEEIIGRPIGEVAVDEPWKKIEQLVHAVAHERTPQPGQVGDDVGRTWDILAMPFAAGLEKRPRVIVILWDVSQVVALQATVSQSQRMAAMGALLGGVAHEVRNPLFAISATLDALETLVGVEYREYFEVLHEEVDRLTNLMQDLLMYGKRSSSFVYESFGSVVDRAVAACRLSAAKKNVTLDVSNECRDSSILVDLDRLSRAFQNVVENAVQHSSEGGTVTIKCFTQHDESQSWIETLVSDRGPGFAEDDLPRVFEPFFSRRKGGTGLGLAIVDQIVQEHGGRVRARNGDGKGAEVVILLPKEERLMSAR